MEVKFVFTKRRRGLKAWLLRFLPCLIAAADIKWWLTGGASNSDPDASLGGARSTTTQVVDATSENLFDNVTGDEASAGDTEYRCFAIQNDHGTDTWSTVVAWIQTETPAGDSVDMALTTSGKNAAAEGPVANENTAPSGPSFSHPTSKGAGISLPDLNAGDYICIWLKRIVPSTTPAYTGNSVVIRIEGDSPA